MQVKDIAVISEFTAVNAADGELPITSVYCGDLLSIVMSKAPAECAWVTVMGNVNSIAVAVLAEISVIILAENAAIDPVALAKAQEEGINVYKTTLPVFESGLLVKVLL
jgi:hypothetical protein